MKNKKVILILTSLLIILIMGITISGASKNTTISTIVNVTGTSSDVNETFISGYVINNLNKSGLPNWNVQLFGITKDYKVINKLITTNSDGLYRFNNLSKGRYTIVLNLKPRYVPVGTSVLQISLKENQKSGNNNFTVVSANEFIFNIGKFRNFKWW